MDKYKKLKKDFSYLSLYSTTNNSINLSELQDKDAIEGLKSLRLVEVNDIANYNKYRLYDYFLILKDKEGSFYFLDTTIDESNKPLKLNDYNIYIRKEKLEKIFNEQK